MPVVSFGRELRHDRAEEVGPVPGLFGMLNGDIITDRALGGDVPGASSLAEDK